MDSHISGKTKPDINYGAELSQRGIQMGFATASGSYGILETYGATATAPILVEVIAIVTAVCNGTAAPTIVIDSYVGTTATTQVASTVITTGTVGSYTSSFVLTADAKIRLTWVKGTGSPTTGNVWVFVRIAGHGKGKYLNATPEV